MEAPDFDSKQQRAASWAKCQRSLQDAGKTKPEYGGERSKRSDKCPAHILSQLSGQEEKLFYFHLWVNCGEKWAAVQIYEEHHFRTIAASEDVEAWLTRAQMAEIWKDDAVITAMQEWAEAQQDEVRVRAHPKIPHVAAARQWKVQVSEQYQKRMESVVDQHMQLSFGAEGPAGEDVVRNMLARSNAAHGRGGALPATSPSPGLNATINAPQKRPSSAVSIEDIDDDALPDEKKRRERLDRFKRQEEERAARAAHKAVDKEKAIAQRKQDAQAAKEARQAQAKTPEGRAKVWLNGLQDHINKCEAELKACKCSKCPPPGCLSKEYSAMWASRILSFKRARTTIEQVLNGHKENRDMKDVIAKAEDNVKSFKTDYQRYKTLFRSYDKKGSQDDACEE